MEHYAILSIAGYDDEGQEILREVIDVTEDEALSSLLHAYSVPDGIGYRSEWYEIEDMMTVQVYCETGIRISRVSAVFYEA